MNPTRRLAAILAADVAGYSRLIGADEGGTLARLRTIRAELIDPLITTHHGRLVKTTGDGLLVEFSSVVDALHAATEVQAGMAERRHALAIKGDEPAVRASGDRALQGASQGGLRRADGHLWAIFYSIKTVNFLPFSRPWRRCEVPGAGLRFRPAGWARRTPVRSALG
jgi:hypothetical protein